MTKTFLTSLKENVSPVLGHVIWLEPFSCAIFTKALERERERERLHFKMYTYLPVHHKHIHLVITLVDCVHS